MTVALVAVLFLGEQFPSRSIVITGRKVHPADVQQKPFLGPHPSRQTAVHQSDRCSGISRLI
jgi:hypothetical protein